jgi:exodeoxyribonuclease-5
MQDITLTKDQSNAIALVNDFLPDPVKKSFTVSGPAGTGKTTLLRQIKDRLADRTVICAPTNKAVSVLRSKGFEKATTLDKVLNLSAYNPIIRPPTAQEIAYYQEHELDIPTAIEEERYSKIDNTDGGVLVCVDEASMTSEEQHNRLTNLFQKVVFVGDGYQLPPVEGDAWFQQITPDVTLNEVVRTAAQSEITQVANLIRRRSPEWRTRDWQAEVSIVSRHDKQSVDEALLNAGIVLCHKNDTCDLMNLKVRELRNLIQERDPYKPVKDDKLLSWVTDKKTGLIKSEIYDVAKAYPLNGGYRVKLEGVRTDYVDVKKAALIQQKSDLYVSKLFKMSYAHAITVHKSQGSEWQSVVVLVYDHATKFTDHWNWLYTACTRAKQHLTIIV